MIKPAKPTPPAFLKEPSPPREVARPARKPAKKKKPTAKEETTDEEEKKIARSNESIKESHFSDGDFDGW